MKIWYYELPNGNKVGSTSLRKIRILAKLKDIYDCDISEFEGHLLSDEYI